MSVAWLSRVIAFTLLAVIGAVPSFSAEPGKRIALVIGNSAYKHTSPLVNPVNDAEDMARTLSALGFQVSKGLDLNKTDMDRTVSNFASALKGAEIGLFFYAGHGMQVSGENYLVPVDARLESTSALDFETLRLNVVQRIMENETLTNVLILDACRDNPLTRNLARALGTRSSTIGKGLAPQESGAGTIISYSTQPGNVALDGVGGRNSPFAGALVKHLPTEGKDLATILVKVRNDVMTATAKRQVPWEHSALTSELILAGPVASSQAPRASSAQGPETGSASTVNEPSQSGSAPISPPRVAEAAAPTPQKASVPNKRASQDENAPVAIELGEIVKGRLPAKKFSHYWKIKVEGGSYRIVLDAENADDSSSNLFLGVHGSRVGRQQEKKYIDTGAVGFFHGTATLVNSVEPGEFVFRVSNEINIVDYRLAVFPADDGYHVPYLGDSPLVKPIAIGQSIISSDLPAPPSRLSEAWHAVDLEPGDYEVTVEMTRTDGLHTNLFGDVELLNAIGIQENKMRICNLYEIGASAKCTGKIILAEPFKGFIRAYPTQKARYSIKTTLKQVE
jgi:uncharacterized caspase-like protein